MDIYIYGQVEGGTQYPIEVASGLQRKETSSPIGSEFTALLENYDRTTNGRADRLIGKCHSQKG